MTGTGTVAAGFDFVIRGLLELPEARFNLAGGTVSHGRELLVEGLDISTDLSLGPYRPKEIRGTAVFDYLLGSVRLEGGVIPDLRAFNRFLPAAGSLAFDGGTASFAMSIDKPSAEEGSSGRVEIAADDADLRLAGRQVNLSAGFGPPDSQSIGGLARYADRPTITYTPLVGHRFTRSLLTPIPPVALVYLVRAGWSVDMVFRTCVRSINGLSNRSARIARPETLPLFDEILEILERVQLSGEVGMRIDERAEGAAALMFFGGGAATADMLRLILAGWAGQLRQSLDELHGKD